jgi:6-phosphogluconolactonase
MSTRDIAAAPAAAGMKSDMISVYAIGQASGKLSPLQKYPGGQGANRVEIVSIG